MNAISISRYAQRIVTQQIQIPQLVPNSDEILIKMSHAPINPSDVYYSQGMYGLRKPLPTTIGFQGSGVVMDTSNSQDRNLIGKQVACWADDAINSGTWAQYFQTNSTKVIEFSSILKENEMAQISSPFINPFTALGFVDLGRTQKTEAVILNAGFSAVSQMAIKRFQKEGIKTIIIVRKKEQQQELKRIGGTYVLNSENENFMQEIKDCAHQEKAKVFFDAVGGDLAGNIFTAMPNDSSLISYGVFSLKTINKIDPAHLVFKGKDIQGFWLSQYFSKFSPQAQIDLKNCVKNELFEDGDFQTQIRQIYEIQQCSLGISQTLSLSGEGKTILQL